MTVAERWPERVTALVLSGASGDPVGVRSLAYRGLAAAFAFGPTPVLVAVDRRFVRWRFGAVVAESVLAGGLWHRSGVPALRSLVGRRFSRQLAAYPGPVLVLNGELDLFFRLTEPAFLRSIGQPTRVLIRRATHLANLDQPEAFTAAVRAFARKVQADAASVGSRAAGGPMVSSGDRPTPS